MTRDNLFELFGISDLNDLPSAINAVLFGDADNRHHVYRELIRLNNGDLSTDWFQNFYESELSERKQKKQDFTPADLSKICSMLTEQEGTIHEPTAGCGSMIINDWWLRCSKLLPYEHFPSQNIVTCWELSDRSIPILLLNLSIRGIMGYVYHGDVLENHIKQKYILLNRTDDTLAFSEIVKVNINDNIVRDDTI